MNPFDDAAREILRVRTLQLASEGRVTAGEPGVWVQHMTVGDESMGLLIGKVRRLGKVGRLLRVPKADPSLLGICQGPEGVLPVFDLRTALGLPLGQLAERAPVLWIGDVEPEFGLSVHDLGSLETLPRSALSPVPQALETRLGDWLFAVGPKGLPVLDSEKIYQSPRFYVGAAPAAPSG